MHEPSNISKTASNFVTVVSIGNENYEKPEANDNDYITVLHIGEKTDDNEDVTEEVLVYRLPGERLGFGLKFEGGTKATEYVKRLYIQSCAPDSPASRVMSSWGNLTEGDEVLIIDSRPVNSMTRMECVKCLKDSNVIIKLLVRHLKRKLNSHEVHEDLPQVISAEKKKQPPPPPPVPPRKIPRKLLKSKTNNENDKVENPSPPARQRNFDSNNNSKNIIVRSYSPEVKTRIRKYSDGSIGPPEAEYYTDLISQESLHSLSESDDTASTISTVIDRNGSLPTTPRSIQKHLDISNFPDDEEIFNSSDFKLANENSMYHDEIDACNNKTSSSSSGIIAEYKSDDPIEDLDELKKKLSTIHDENMNIFNLPRLVDFVPKNCNENDQMKMMNLFIDNERRERYDLEIIEEDYPKLSVSPQLATIGEVEEESNHSSDGSTSATSLPMPIVIVQNADDDIPGLNATNRIMDSLPSDSRQPPDGHEFPDFEESFQRTNSNDQFYTTQPTSMSKSKHENENNSKTFDLTKTSDDSSAIKVQFKGENPSSYDKKQTEQWNNLVEQRRKGLSKLKGLVIPDSENDCNTSSTINLPEIKSKTVPIETFDSLDSFIETSRPSSAESTCKVPQITPPWTGNTNFPKYSPAFKRKDLKLYSKQQEIPDIKTRPFNMRKSLSTTESSSGDDSTIPLQSLDSSPTRSEVNFEYTRNKPKQRTRPVGLSMETSLLNDYHKNKKEINTEDESDNDSAVSSSQSSFISRPTTSPSPTRSIEYDNVQKGSSYLKPSSIEAINRRNILASAKCRSGKDLKCDTPILNEEKSEDTLKRVEVENKQEKPDEIKPSSLSSINPIPKPTTVHLKTKFETLAIPLKQTNIPPSPRPIKENTNTKPIFKEALKPTPKTTKVVVPKPSRIVTSSNKISVTDLRKNFEEKANNIQKSQTNLPNMKDTATTQTSATPEINRIEEKISKIPEAKPRKSVIKTQTTAQAVASVKTRKVVLKPTKIDDNLGISLLGGNEENKEITIRRIRYGSVAYQEGSLSKGDHIVSINGTETNGLSQDQAMDLLKAPSKSFVITVSVKEEIKDDGNETTQKKRTSSFTDAITTPNSEVSQKKANYEITLQKDGSGLGFSIEGGKDSPQGNVPLIVKKLFQGGVAEKDGRLKVGDEILAINNIDFTNFTRIQAWTMMKKIDVGPVKILLYR